MTLDLIEDITLPPASGEKDHISMALANSTIALTGGHTIDLLGTPARAKQWLAVRNLALESTDMRETCATQMRSLREHVRSLLASRTEGLPAHPAALAAINDALIRVPTAALLQWDEKGGPYRAVPHPTTAIVDHALATIATDVADLLTSGDADRITSCRSSPCNRYLLRYGRRQWCSVRCGDRARAARAYARRSDVETAAKNSAISNEQWS